MLVGVVVVAARTLRSLTWPANCSSSESGGGGHFSSERCKLAARRSSGTLRRATDGCPKLLDLSLCLPVEKFASMQNKATKVKKKKKMKKRGLIAGARCLWLATNCRPLAPSGRHQ